MRLIADDENARAWVSDPQPGESICLTGQLRAGEYCQCCDAVPIGPGTGVEIIIANDAENAQRIVV